MVTYNTQPSYKYYVWGQLHGMMKLCKPLFDNITISIEKGSYGIISYYGQKYQFSSERYAIAYYDSRIF